MVRRSICNSLQSYIKEPRGTESEEHYFLICPKHNNGRRSLFDHVSNKLFSSVNYNTFIILMPKYYDVFKYIYICQIDVAVYLQQ